MSKCWMCDSGLYQKPVFIDDVLSHQLNHSYNFVPCENWEGNKPEAGPAQGKEKA